MDKLSALTVIAASACLIAVSVEPKSTPAATSLAAEAASGSVVSSPQPEVFEISQSLPSYECLCRGCMCKGPDTPLTEEEFIKLQEDIKKNKQAAAVPAPIAACSGNNCGVQYRAPVIYQKSSSSYRSGPLRRLFGR